MKIGNRMKLCLGIATLAFVLAGCGSQEGRKKVADDGRTVITLGNIDESELQYDVEDAVTAFNNTNTEYKIEIVDYSEREDEIAAFNMDVAAGKCPDVIVSSFRQVDQMLGIGLLEDLKPYLEKDDTLHPEDFLDNMLEIWTEEDHMYYMGNNYYAVTMFGKKENLGKYAGGWTMDEMMTFAKSTDIPLFYVNDKLQIFDNITAAGFGEFMDMEQKRGLFDSALFQDILEYSNRGVKNSDRTSIDEEAVTAFLKDACCLDIIALDDFMDIEDMTRFYGSDLVCVGMPNANRSISGIRFQVNIAMYSKSEYKDVVWDFIKSLYTKEAQCGTDLSVRKDVFAMQKKAAMATEEYVDEMGNTVSPIHCESPTYLYTPLTNAEVELVEQIVTGAGYSAKSDKGIESIVQDEVETYFNGDCQIESVGKTINNRVETYLHENE